MDYQAFRQKLAGLVEPGKKIDATTNVAIKDAAIRLCTIFASLFGDSLDRQTIWGRIGSALQTSCAKVSDDDTDRFIALCLEHIQADDGQVSRSEPLSMVIAECTMRGSEYRFAFLAYIHTHRMPLLVHARNRWDGVKKGTVEL